MKVSELLLDDAPTGNWRAICPSGKSSWISTDKRARVRRSVRGVAKPYNAAVA
jgi:hypothetical protein